MPETKNYNLNIEICSVCNCMWYVWLFSHKIQLQLHSVQSRMVDFFCASHPQQLRLNRIHLGGKGELRIVKSCEYVQEWNIISRRTSQKSLNTRRMRRKCENHWKSSKNTVLESFAFMFRSWSIKVKHGKKYELKSREIYINMQPTKIIKQNLYDEIFCVYLQWSRSVLAVECTHSMMHKVELIRVSRPFFFLQSSLVSYAPSSLSTLYIVQKLIIKIHENYYGFLDELKF